MRPSLFLAPLLAALTTAIPFTDVRTSISYSAFFHTSGYSFGIALPLNTSSGDFIGLVTGKATGWSGTSLGGAMTNKLLIAAWPSGKTVLGSFRKTARIASPPEVTGSYSLLPIANGTYTNATHWSFTFLCKACIQTDGTTFARTAATDMLGWAHSTSAPATPSSKATTFSKHSAEGQYSANFTAARNVNFEKWASWAK
ncbi:hypothetical protein VTL71DRAFT_5063 [Oculimacula yallundae]|uniref:Cellobiose dehydrogenase-like cytochrome domain-containing protein n=1 Tax=Oculimacula yallundae TaxID=86028 RepID=A0ABR4C025_9HELO